jgi:hypothetical protein
MSFGNGNGSIDTFYVYRTQVGAICYIQGGRVVNYTTGQYTNYIELQNKGSVVSMYWNGAEYWVISTIGPVSFN